MHRLSLLKPFIKSFREIRASASTKPPTTAATSFPSTPCNYQMKQMLWTGLTAACCRLKPQVAKYHTLLQKVSSVQGTYCSRNSSQHIFPSCGNQLPRLIFHHWLSKPLPLEPIISKSVRIEAKKSSALLQTSYKNICEANCAQ